MFDNSTSTSPQWERQTLQKVLLEHISEQRRARRWAIFFKLVLIGVVVWLIFGGGFNRDIQPTVMSAQAHTALIDIDGEIGAGTESSADNIRESIKIAFGNKHVKGIVLRINSPGGSPVQARQVFDEIRAQRIKHPNIKLYAAIEDLGASAAYLIASAADGIYADKTSLVGSIGAKIDSFGFVEVMQKVGVERRLYVGGKYKGILDPFSPRDPVEDAFIDNLLKGVHQAFIDNVKTGRGDRLKETPELFSGLVWSGDQALNLGLIDGYGDAQYIAREIVKAENLLDYTPNVTFVDRITRKIGASLGDALAGHLGLSAKGVR